MTSFYISESYLILKLKYFLTDGGGEDAQSSAVSGAQNRYDDCSGVQCPELDCPTRPYIPQGECCPICPGLFSFLISLFS